MVHGLGAYLASSAYLTACLFAWLKKTRDSTPYLRLGSDDDTRLSVLMLRVSHSFLRDQGIYYVLQPSIGQDMILADEDRLISYREFCELLLTPARRVWLDRLIAYYLETGRGMKLDRVADAIAAMEALSAFLDDVAGGGESVRSRLAAEGIFRSSDAGTRLPCNSRPLPGSWSQPDYMLPADSALPAAASDETYLPSGPAGDAANDVTVTPTTGTAPSDMMRGGPSLATT